MKTEVKCLVSSILTIFPCFWSRLWMKKVVVCLRVPVGALWMFYFFKVSEIANPHQASPCGGFFFVMGGGSPGTLQCVRFHALCMGFHQLLDMMSSGISFYHHYHFFWSLIFLKKQKQNWEKASLTYGHHDFLLCIYSVLWKMMQFSFVDLDE